MNKQIIENLKDEISLCEKQIESWKWVKSEKEKYQGIFDRYKKKYKLSTTKAILNIMDIIEKIEKL